MSYCEKCGFPIPDGAGFCPNCGTSIRRKTEVSPAYVAPIGRIIQAGVLGAFLSIMISSVSPQGMDLYFIPSFLSSLVAIFLSRTRRLNEAITIALTVYLSADAMMAGIALGTLYSQRMPLAEIYGDYVPTLIDVIMYTANPITAVVAGYIGNRLTSKTPTREAAPMTYRREEEQHGGVIYSLRRNTEVSSSMSHNV